MSEHQTVAGASVKNRATVICCQDDRILLVARARSRWSLPGGSIKRTESPSEAARRELEEETSLVDVQVEYLFHFGGLSKRHHVFVAHLSSDASPEPRNEIQRCEWFGSTKVSTLITSVPTREIVGLFVRHTRLATISPPVELEVLTQ
jgi:8-oxo-dGTP diphosphatase